MWCTDKIRSAFYLKPSLSHVCVFISSCWWNKNKFNYISSQRSDPGFSVKNVIKHMSLMWAKELGLCAGSNDWGKGSCIIFRIPGDPVTKWSTKQNANWLFVEYRFRCVADDCLLYKITNARRLFHIREIFFKWNHGLWEKTVFGLRCYLKLF